jgi:hypothetical protein
MESVTMENQVTMRLEFLSHTVDSQAHSAGKTDSQGTYYCWTSIPLSDERQEKNLTLVNGQLHVQMLAEMESMCI